MRFIEVKKAGESAIEARMVNVEHIVAVHAIMDRQANQIRSEIILSKGDSLLDERTPQQIVVAIQSAPNI